MGLQLLYVAKGHYIFQIRQLSFKINLRSMTSNDLRFQP